MIAGGTVYHLLSDHVGSVRLVVTTGGAVQQRIDYDAWGRIKQDTNPGFQPFGFAGGIWDADAGLVLMGARWYDPVTGRFISRDPVRFDGGFNLYAYADNDPVNKFDPQGTFVQFSPLVAPTAVEIGFAIVLGYQIADLIFDFDATCTNPAHSHPNPYRPSPTQCTNSGPSPDPFSAEYLIWHYDCLDGYSFSVRRKTSEGCEGTYKDIRRRVE